VKLVGIHKGVEFISVRRRRDLMRMLAMLKIVLLTITKSWVKIGVPAFLFLF
jgi:hypothetical protein